MGAAIYKKLIKLIKKISKRKKGAMIYEKIFICRNVNIYYLRDSLQQQNVE